MFQPALYVAFDEVCHATNKSAHHRHRCHSNKKRNIEPCVVYRNAGRKKCRQRCPESSAMERHAATPGHYHFLRILQIKTHAIGKHGLTVRLKHQLPPTTANQRQKHNMCAVCVAHVHWRIEGSNALLNIYQLHKSQRTHACCVAQHSQGMVLYLEKRHREHMWLCLAVFSWFHYHSSIWPFFNVRHMNRFYRTMQYCQLFWCVVF